MLKKNTIPQIFKKLSKYDTPTICNALELIDPKCQGSGYTKEPLICLDKSLPPIIGFVRTVKIHSGDKKTTITDKQRKDYYTYMNQGKVPKICVVQDTNNKPMGCFWGEVQTNIHKCMGVKGTITNGAIRDVHMAAKDYQMLAKYVLPSHAYERIINFGKKIHLCGININHNDIVHADQHGAVKIPIEYLTKLPKAVNQVIANEKPILEMCKKKKFTLGKLLKIINKKKKYH